MKNPRGCCFQPVGTLLFSPTYKKKHQQNMGNSNYHIHTHMPRGLPPNTQKPASLCIPILVCQQILSYSSASPKFCPIESHVFPVGACAAVVGYLVGALRELGRRLSACPASSCRSLLLPSLSNCLFKSSPGSRPPNSSRSFRAL